MPRVRSNTLLDRSDVPRASSQGPAANGRTVAVWQGASRITSTGVQASVLPPGGTWSEPVTVAPAGINPQVAVDAAGDAVALWATSSSSIASAQAAVLQAGGTWSAPRTLGTGVTPNLAASGQGVAPWTGGNGVQAATARHSQGGGWTAPAQLATSPSSPSGRIAVTPAGSFVVTYAGDASTSPPGQGFGAPVILVPSSNVMQLSAAAGHALAILAMGSNLTAATEPVT